MRRTLVILFLGFAASPAAAAECDQSQPGWLFCEDFEDGAQGWTSWFAASPFVECLGCLSGNQENPDRIHLSDDPAHAFEGGYGLYMPATAAANYRGAALVYRSCQNAKQSGCNPLVNHDELFFRAYVRLAPDHQYVHHFMALSGSRPDRYWETDGNAGCRPNGYRWAGTTLDFDTQRRLFFYTYSPGMSCDSGGYCSGTYAQNICDGCAAKEMPCSNGLECCWGNLYRPSPEVVLDRDRWVCLEMQMKLNTPGQADGEQRFWVDGVLGREATGMQWRDVPELGLNKVFVQHYIDSGDATQPNRIAWDNIIASTQRVGCMTLPPADAGTGPGSPDAGASSGADAGQGGGGAGPGASLPDAGGGGAGAVGSGCGCHAAAGSGWTLWAGGIFVLVRRRRR